MTIKNIQPKTVEELEEYIASGSLERVGSKEVRSPLSHYYYKYYRKVLPKKIVDKILKNRIKRKVFKGVSITSNMFPYDKLLGKTGAKHYIVWQVDNSVDFDKKSVEKIVLEWFDYQKIKPQWHYIYKNIEAKKSIKAIDHFHLFFK